MVGNNQYIFCQTALRSSTGSYRNASSTLSYQSGTAKNSGVEISEGAWKNTSTNITSLYFYFGGGTFTGRLVMYALQ
jgi:hypothetical protein